MTDNEQTAEKNAATCPRCGHPNLDHYRGFCHHYSTEVSMCGCRVTPTDEENRPPTHLLIVKDGERLTEHKTACGLLGVEVPATDGLTQSWLSFTCRPCGQAFSRVTSPDERKP